MPEPTQPATQTAAQQPKRGPGRPKGTPNRQADIVDRPPSRCKRCGSTRRAPYTGTPVVIHGPGKCAGQAYTRMTRRRTHCLDCGQYRVDQELTFEPTPEEKFPPAISEPAPE